MASQNHDTDPSTPGAKRLSEPRTPNAAAVALAEDGPPFDGEASDVSRAPLSRSRPTTDPGIAPPPGPLPVPRQPMGIVVPPAVVRANDSVDVLLDGISREQPERARATAQTEGQSAATYHGEHAVRAARSAPVEEPKVVIDRATPPETVRVPRLPALAEVDPRVWGETTAVRPQPLGARVFIAIAAGVAVVLVIFVALQRTSPIARLAPPLAPPSGASPAPPLPPTATASVPSATLAAVPVGPDIAATPAIPNFVAESLPPAGPTAVAPSATARTAAPVVRAVRAKPAVTVPPAPRPAGTDLGEFKSAL
jgi:hypothetical protein